VQVVLARRECAGSAGAATRYLTLPVDRRDAAPETRQPCGPDERRLVARWSFCCDSVSKEGRIR